MTGVVERSFARWHLARLPGALVDTLKICFEWGITLFLASDTSLLVKISTKRWQTSLQFFSG